MYEYNLPVDFPQEVLNEAELMPEIITEKEISRRRDLRNVTTIGIDPHDSKDADDTIGLEFKDGKRFISINIADVTHYIKPGSELDKEALRRSTSVYLVDRCVPMLPERLSNGICSLKPNVDRLAFSVVFNIDSSGKIISEWHGKTVIHSDHRFSYEQAQSIIESVDKPISEVGKILTEDAGLDMDYKRATELGSCVIQLNKLAKKIRKKRIKDGSIEMGGVEVKFELAPDNKKPIGVYFKEQKE